MSKTRILLVSDYLLSPERMRLEFVGLEKYDVEFTSIIDRPNDTNEEFQERMLQLEVAGPESIEPPVDLMRAVEDVEIIVVHFTVVTEAIIRAARNLKLIAVLRGGWENVNVAAATARGIKVVNSPGRSGDAVSDFTVGLMIAESKNIVRSSIGLRQGAWAKDFPNRDFLHNMRGRVVGIIGLGEIGARVAKKLKGFDVELLAFDPYLTEAKIRERGCTPSSLDSLLKESDFVTLHIRFTSETKHLIGQAQLDLMKPTAYLINTARAGLVDESALIGALQNRTIAGAAIDVFNVEPLPADSPFFQLENVTITPHLAGTSADTLSNSFEILGEELTRYLLGEDLQFVKN